MLRALHIASYLVIALGFLTAASSARADWYFKFVRVTCVPEAAYAAVETFGIYNLGPEENAALAAKGIHELATLVQTPVSCDLPQGKMIVQVQNYHPPMDGGRCSGVEDADLSVSLNGTEVALAESTHGGCESVRQHDIWITQHGVTHCLLEFRRPPEILDPGDFATIPASCKNLEIGR